VQLSLSANIERSDVTVHVAQRRSEKRAGERTADENIGRFVRIHQRPGQYDFVIFNHY